MNHIFEIKYIIIDSAVYSAKNFCKDKLYFEIMPAQYSI